MLKILIIFAVTVIISLLICFLFFALTKKDTKKISDNFFFGFIYPVVIVFAFSCWLLHENKKQFNQELPKIIQTISQPQVDTTITIIENVRDTSYTYYFFNYFVD